MYCFGSSIGATKVEKSAKRQQIGESCFRAQETVCWIPVFDVVIVLFLLQRSFRVNYALIGDLLTKYIFDNGCSFAGVCFALPEWNFLHFLLQRVLFYAIIYL